VDGGKAMSRMGADEPLTWTDVEMALFVLIIALLFSIAAMEVK
jgi:hypothetical protein